MKRILFSPILAIVFTACQKEVDGGNGNTGGNNTSSSLDYQPVSANSEWDYRSTTR